MTLKLASPVFLSLVLLVACVKTETEITVTPEGATGTSLSNTIQQATVEARMNIMNGNMTLEDKIGKTNAEITPKGDLLIDGKAVTITPEQRQLLINHRELLVKIAISGVEIGLKGVDLAGEAIGETVKGIFSGDTKSIEKKVEAKAEKIEESARTLCDQLPLLRASQEKLGASLPEFKPYATMTTKDTIDCHTDTKIKR